MENGVKIKVLRKYTQNKYIGDVLNETEYFKKLI